MKYTELVKKAATMTGEQLNDYYLSDSRQDTMLDSLLDKGRNDPYLLDGHDVLNPFYNSMVNVNLADDKQNEVLAPANKDGVRGIKTVSPEAYAQAQKNFGALEDPKNVRYAWRDYIASLQQKRNDEINAGSIVSGGATAVASYLGLGLLPRLRRYRVIRAMMSLAAGAGVGYAYHEMADPNIYRNVDWDKVRDSLNEKIKANPKAYNDLRKIVKSKAGKNQPFTIDKITPISSIPKEEQERRDAARAFIKRYGVDAGVGAATGLGSYLGMGLIPGMKNRRLLRAMLAGGLGIGAGAITDTIVKPKDEDDKEKKS